MAKYLNPKVDLTFKKVFGEHPNLVKYKPKDRGSRAIKDLWLRFLIEIDESTQKADDVLLENPEISQALEVLETSAYTDADMYAYNDALLEIMTHHNAMKNKREDGYAEGEAIRLAEGRVEGLADGELQAKLAVARSLKAAGVDISIIANSTGLAPDEISKI